MPCGTSLSAVPGQTTIPWQQHPPGLRERQGRKAVQGRSASSPFQGPYTRLGNPQAMHYRKPQSLERPLGTVSHCNGQKRPGWLTPHGACRKARCLAVCGDWGPPQQQDSAFCSLAAEKLELLSSYKLPVSLCMGGNDERAAFQMSQDEGSSLLMCSFVERGKRLIEKHKP